MLGVPPLRGGLIAAAVLSMAAAPPPARVAHTTRARAYFDRGSSAGFAPGARVEVDGRTCTIDRASEHHASCPAPMRAGAVARLSQPAKSTEPSGPHADGPRAGPSIARGPAPPPLAPAPFVKVEAPRGSFALAAPPIRTSAAARHSVWAGASTSGTHQRTDVAVSLDHAHLGFLGLEAAASLMASGYPQRPDVARFRAGTDVALYVFEASLASRDPHRPYTLSVGRIRPWHAPGLVAIDGVQAGWSHAGLEVGAFGGFVPDLITLAPAADSWTAGAYWGAVHQLGEEVRLIHEGRVAAVGEPDTSPRGELEVRARAELPAGVDGGAGARIGAGSDGVALLAVSADLGARPAEVLGVRAEYRERHEGAGIFDGRHAGGAVDLDVVPWLTLSAIGGWAAPLDAAGRAYAGPEVSARGVIPGALDLAAGYQEELGDAPGRLAWLQVILRPAEGWRFAARGTWIDDRGGAEDAHSASIWGSLRARVTDFLDAGASGLVMLPVAGSAPPASGAFRVALESSF